jgi:Domain of unknown function (DUF4202)
VLEQIHITRTDPGLLRELASDFPSIHVSSSRPDGISANEVVVRASEWRAPAFDVYRFDGALDRADHEGAFALHVLDDDPPRSAAVEILNRCQRTIRRRNRGSESARFDAVLAMHRRMHDVDKPLVRADYNHALDTWQWLLRLEPRASTALQLAALFHDVERISSEADRRVEHLAADYRAFKNGHAAAGAEIARGALRECGIDEATCGRVAELIAHHEHRATRDAEVLLLNDADALSFFSLNSPGFADYYGPEHTRRKIDYTLGRLGAEARGRLRSIHLRNDVKALFAACTL